MKLPGSWHQQFHSNLSGLRSALARVDPLASPFWRRLTIDRQEKRGDSCRYRSALSAYLRDANRAGRGEDRICARCGRLFPSVGQVRSVIWPHHTRVGCDYQSGFRVERLRELVKGDVAGPLIVIGVPGNRHFAVPLLSNWHPRGHDVADIPVNVGVDRVLPRAPYALQRVAKFFPVSCFAKPGIAVGEPARLGSSPAQGVGLVALAKHDWAVAGHGDFEVFIRLSLDANRFVKD